MPLTPQQQQENFDRKVTGLEDKLSDLKQEQEKIRFRGLPRNSFLNYRGGVTRKYKKGKKNTKRKKGKKVNKKTYRSYKAGGKEQKKNKKLNINNYQNLPPDVRHKILELSGAPEALKKKKETERKKYMEKVISGIRDGTLRM